MSIRTRLTLLGGLFTAAVLLNIVSLLYLARSVSDSLTIVEHVRQRQLVAVQMSAHLRDAEAALYRYQIEGEVGFTLQFSDRMDDFAADVEQYGLLATDSVSQNRALSLAQSAQRVQSLGDQLIALRDNQSQNFEALLTSQGHLTDLLAEIRAEGDTQQSTLDSVQEASRTMLITIAAYLTVPDEDTRIRYTDATVDVQHYATLLDAATNTPEERARTEQLNATVTEMQSLASQLISERDLQQSLYANFIANVFSAADEIVGKINPHEAEGLVLAQQSLESSVRWTIAISVLVPSLATIVSGWLIYRMSGQVNTNVRALLRGAERVAVGNYAQSVYVSGTDELARLASSFNHMTSELGIREERLRVLMNKLAHIQDEERRLIGLDLHDGLTQLIISANMHLNTLSALAHPKLDTQAVQELDVSRMLIKQAIDEARRVIAELRPTVIEDFGLQDGFRRYVAQVCESERWRCEIVSNLGALNTTPSIDTAIFRIAQEALTNVRKHAQTERVHVSLTVEKDTLVLSVRDWGRGFDMNAFVDDSSQLGLVSMKERTEMLGGVCHITSEPGKGTLVQIQIPLPALASRSMYGREG